MRYFTRTLPPAARVDAPSTSQAGGGDELLGDADDERPPRVRDDPSATAHHGRHRRCWPVHRGGGARRCGRWQRRWHQRQAAAADRARHDRPARQRLQLGLLQGCCLPGLRRQPRRPGEGCHPHQGGPGRARAGHLHHPRRRRHDPGHPARLLLREDRPHHQWLEAPHGAVDEPRRLRRRRPRQPRVQLRPRPAPHLGGPAQLPAALGELGRLGHRPAGLPALRHQDRQGARIQARQGGHPRARHPRRGDLGQGQRRGQGEVPGHRRAGRPLRPPAQGRWRRRRRCLGPLRRGHVVVLR